MKKVPPTLPGYSADAKGMIRKATEGPIQSYLGMTLDIYTCDGYRGIRGHQGGGAFHVAGRASRITVVGMTDARTLVYGFEAPSPLPKVYQVFAAGGEAPAFILVKRGGRMGNVLVPVTDPIGADGKPLIGPMHGGAYAATSDSRWSDLLAGFYGAVPLHDRFETQALYDRNAD